MNTKKKTSRRTTTPGYKYANGSSGITVEEQSAQVPWGQIGSFAGTAVDTFTAPTKEGEVQSAGASAASGALKGAGAGATIGSAVPVIGTAVGAAAGAVIGGAAGFVKGKSAEKEAERAQILAEKTEAVNKIKPGDFQSNMYQTGTEAIMANGFKPIEVERDEVVMRKNKLGHFRVVADFKGGKTHANGGEAYVAKDGDVIFPGKMRKKVVGMVKSGDHIGLETKRLKLPSDVPNGRAEKGVKNFDPDVELSKIRQDYHKEVLAAQNELAKYKVPEGTKFPQDTHLISQEKQRLYAKHIPGYAKALQAAYDIDPTIADKPEYSAYEFVKKPVAVKVPTVSPETKVAQENEIQTEQMLANAFNSPSLGAGSDGVPYSLDNSPNQIINYLPYNTVSGYELSKRKLNDILNEGKLAPYEDMKGKPSNNTPRVPASLNPDQEGKYADYDPTYGGILPSPLVDPEAATTVKQPEPGDNSAAAVTAKTPKGGTAPAITKPEIVDPVKSIAITQPGVTPVKGAKASTTTGTPPSTLANVNPTPSDSYQGNEGKGGTALGTILDYLPAAANIVQGFQAPQKVEREFITPETINYKDQSAGLRREAGELERLETDTAVNLSGGSAGNVRSAKGSAYASKFKRLQSIDTAEMSRADKIQQYNAQARQMAKEKNISLKQAYDEMDAQNVAAVQAYTDQGLQDISRITQQKKRDENLAKQQALILDLLETTNFRLDNNKIALKQ